MLFTWVTRATFLFFAVVTACFSKNNRLIFVLLFLFFTLVCIVTTSFDKFELQCQKRLSQINIIVPVPIRLKFKLYAVFIKRGSWINFFFMWGQDIVNNWDFPSKISRHCHKRLIPKIVVWHDQREMFVKMSLRDWLDCLVDFVGMILFCLLPPWCTPTAPFRLRFPSPNCFFRVFFTTVFTAVLKYFLPLKTSPISGAANSNMSALMRFAARTTYLRKKGISVLPITRAGAPIPLPSVFQPLYSMEFLLVLKQPSCSIVLVRKECWTPF